MVSTKENVKLRVDRLRITYGDHVALDDATLDVSPCRSRAMR